MWSLNDNGSTCKGNAGSWKASHLLTQPHPKSHHVPLHSTLPPQSKLCKLHFGSWKPHIASHSITHTSGTPVHGLTRASHVPHTCYTHGHAAHSSWTEFLLIPLGASHHLLRASTRGHSHRNVTLLPRWWVIVLVMNETEAC